MRGPPWKSLGMCRRVTNKGESGFGKVSDRAKAERTLTTEGTSVGCPLNGLFNVGLSFSIPSALIKR